MTPRVLRFMFLLLACSALARMPDGTLGTLLLPNDARPAVAAPLGTVEFVATTAGQLAIKSDAYEQPVDANWTERNGKWVAEYALPADLPIGMYTVVWSGNGQSDQNNRSLFVVEPATESYRFACLALGADESSTTLRTLTDSDARAVFVFTSGPESAMPQTLANLSSFQMPTFLIADLAATALTKWIGESNLVVPVGPDVFIAPDSGATGLGDELSPVAGDVAKTRATYQTARWITLLIPRADVALAPRNQLTLFVDTPVTAVFAGSTGSNAQAPAPVAWAGWFEPTPIVVIPSGRIVVFDANRATIAPFKPEPPVSATSGIAPR